ncbi:DUF447 domain-containing protein [Halorussus halophilus]|uniref:DUF447 domain-containing protein n=1 Tax=Halorussus halophilus TaxID=2650975 RepID=UPI0013015A75|nr:DUF447 domain-containing protein [Halorussus halophilus]
MTANAAEWPIEWSGVTESLVTTLGPNERWNVAALGLHPPDEGRRAGVTEGAVTAETWGNTRTRRNFHRQGGGYVQFTRDPVAFTNAALSIYEVDAPVLDSADAWVEVDVELLDSNESDGTTVETWALTPVESGVEREVVPTINRGFAAVVEATVAASRLDVDAYETETLRDRLDYFETVGRNCGGERVRAAFDRLHELLD